MKEEEAPKLKTSTALQCETTSDEEDDNDDDDDDDADGKTAVEFVSIFQLLLSIYCCKCSN